VPEAFLSFATGLALSTAAGFNAYVPLLVTGVLARSTDLIALEAPFDRLEEPVVLAVIGAVGLVDFVGDKVPAIDHVLHAIGFVVAPITGAFLALGVAADDGALPAIALVSGAVAAGAAQGARSSVRPLSTVATGGIGNPALSLGEDGLSATLSFTAIVVPIVALVLAAAVLVVLVVAIRRFRRAVRSRMATPPT
jgi:Domain of unknown function (DUF4126)